MSYHFLCKRGIRPARTEQFLVSSSFHRLDMTLAVAEALTPNKPINQAYSFPVDRDAPETIADAKDGCLDNYWIILCDDSPRHSTTSQRPA